MEFKVGDSVTTQYVKEYDTPPSYVGLEGVIESIDNSCKICQVVVNNNRQYTIFIAELVLIPKLWKYGI